jgi:hypothetical protein
MRGRKMLIEFADAPLGHAPACHVVVKASHAPDVNVMVSADIIYYLPFHMAGIRCQFQGNRY